jgi:hypothetical protein
LRITNARAGCYRQRLTAFSTQAFADRFDVATKPHIILTDQHSDVLGQFVRFTPRTPGGAVTRQHVQFLRIENQLYFPVSGGRLPRSLRGFTFCG